MNNKKIVPIYILVLLGGIIAVLITGCLPQPMVKPALNKVVVAQLGVDPGEEYYE